MSRYDGSNAGDDSTLAFVLAAITSAAVIGIDAYAITVEVDSAQGLPQWTIVGLAAGAVKESRERVGAALVNSGFSLPPRRITVNLAPADVRKEGTAFDLPIALGVLAATGQINAACVVEHILVGELGLDGSLRAIRGALPLARYASRCAETPRLVLPRANLAEASRVSGARLVAPSSLRELVDWLQTRELPLAEPGAIEAPSVDENDWCDVVGQPTAKRALEVAAAGGHNVLLIGPPGGGKTMLARRMTTILPPMSDSEALEVISIASVAGILTEQMLANPRRPFRAPHHTISTAGLVGGGTPPRPGEVSLAHHGLLFLDEMLEFPRHVLDVLRQPMEDGHVVIARAAHAVRYPARFSFIGATNPCPCGRAGDSRATCTCTLGDAQRYRARLSGPLADRVDMHILVPAVAPGDLSRTGGNETSQAVRARVCAAHVRQRARYSRTFSDARNAHVPGRWLDGNTPIHREARTMLQQAGARLGLSARGYHRALKVARTIADLDGARELAPAHVAEALQYRAAENLHATANLMQSA